MSGPSKQPHKKPKRRQSGRVLIPTRGLQATIVNKIKTGAWHYVAAMAAGISVRTFYNWLQWGREGKAKYAEFFQAVEVAEAEARASAEALVFNNNPLEWLRIRAKTEPDRPGWTETRVPDMASGGPIVADESELDDEYWRGVFRVGFEIAAAGHFPGRMAAALLSPPAQEAVQAEESDE